MKRLRMLGMKPLHWMALAALLPACAFAQAPVFPDRPVTLIVPFTTGTGADGLARLLGPKLSERWKVAVITENRAGASGVIGTDHVAKSAPNGYTLLITATAHGTVPALNPKLPYSVLQAFAPVVLLGTSAMAVLTSGKSPFTSFKDFQDAARHQPGKLTYSTPGTGAPQHLAMELLAQESGLQLLHVPYKGSSGALTDLIGNHVQASIVALQTASPHVLNGSLRMLAVLSPERSPAFPQVPTLRELGLSNLVVETWYGVFVAAGTPPEIVAKLNSDFNTLLQLPDVREAMARQGMNVAGGSPQRLQELVKAELTRWSRVVELAKIQDDK
jgi:tripartite-type tricarboxylate transporter receptor subunit TctC